MKLKYYFLFFVLSLLASCNDEEGLDLHNKPIESNSIVLSPDEYISIAYDNPRVITPDEAKQLALDFGVNRVQTRGNENIVVKFRSSFNIEEKGSNAVTRSVTDKSILLPVYEMEIVSDAGKGLAYVSADERVAKVMAYLPKVNLEDTAKIIGAIIRKSKFPQNPKRSVRFSGKRTKRSVQKRKARNTQKAETKVL